MPRPKEFDYDEKLKVARNLFWKKGYTATSMNELEKALQVNRSSLYQTYGSKHDLFLKSLSNYLDTKEKDYQRAAVSSKDPLEAIANIIQSVLKTILRDQKTCLAVNSTFELGRKDKKVKKLLTDQAHRAVNLFKELLDSAQDKGRLNKDTDTKVLAHFILSSITSIWHTHILFKDEALTKKMTDVLLNSIQK
jgi:TetR/AcrR family transcriptional repressor of nem operon